METNNRPQEAEVDVLMYPSNQLRDQVRDYEETPSPFRVLQEAFFNHE